MSKESSTDKDENNKSKLGKLAKKGLKSGLQVGAATGKFIKDVVEDSLNEKNEIPPRNESSKKKNKENKKKREKRKNETVINFGKGIENTFMDTYSLFWSIIIYIFIIIVSILISNINKNFSFLFIIVLIAFPFFILWRLKVALPGFSITQFFRHVYQISKAFVKEMIRISPFGSAILFLFILILIYVIISRVFFN